MKNIAQKSQVKLAEIRNAIDAIDAKILLLIKKRLSLALRANAIKQKSGNAVRNVQREKFILEKAKREASRKKLPAHDVVVIFQKIIGMCRREQFKARKRS